MPELFKSRILVSLTALSAVLVLVSVGVVFFNLEVLPSKLIIHFDAFRGVDFFGDITDVWWLTGLVACMVALNLGLAVGFFYRERIASYLLVATNVLLSLLLLIAIVTVISVN
jgi:hypothetical protein